MHLDYIYSKVHMSSEFSVAIPFQVANCIARLLLTVEDSPILSLEGYSRVGVC